MTQPERLAVVVSDERASDRSVPVDTQCWADLAHAVLSAEGVTVGELGLMFVDTDEMARLNLAYRGENCVTDVLAFPLDGIASDNEIDQSAWGCVLIGDVVICPTYAASAVAAGNASGDLFGVSVGAGPAAASAVAEGNTSGDSSSRPTASVSLEEELALLVVHGVLHVLGYDHAEPDEAVVMRKREKELLTACRWPAARVPAAHV